MASWNGTFALTGKKNIGEFLKILGISDEAEVKRLTDFTYNVTLSKNGNDFMMKQFTAETEVEVNFTLKKEFGFTTLEGFKVKGIASMPDDRTLHGEFEDGLVEHVELHDDGSITDTFIKGGVKYSRSFIRMKN